MPSREILRRRHERIWANVSRTINVHLAAILVGELLNEHQRPATRTNRVQIVRSKIHGGSLPNVKRSVLFGLKTHVSGACTRLADCQCCTPVDADGPRHDSVLVTLSHHHQTLWTCIITALQPTDATNVTPTECSPALSRMRSNTADSRRPSWKARDTTGG